LRGFWTLSVIRYCWQNLMFGKLSGFKVGETPVALCPAGRTVLHRVQRPDESQLFARCNIHPVAHEATNSTLQRLWKSVQLMVVEIVNKNSTYERTTIGIYLLEKCNNCSVYRRQWSIDAIFTGSVCINIWSHFTELLVSIQPYWNQKLQQQQPTRRKEDGSVYSCSLAPSNEKPRHHHVYKMKYKQNNL